MSWASQAGGWISSTGKGLAHHFGNPGHSNFKATAFQNNPNSGYDPNAFQGGWNDPNSSFNPETLAGNAAAAQNAQAPGFAQAQQGQSALEQLLMGQANGTAPSLAMEQLRQAQGQNAANTMALQASARGLNPAQAALNSANVNANANQNTAAQGVAAALAERNAAQGQLGNVLNQQGSMGLQQQAQNNQMVQYYMSQGMSAEQAQLQANIAQQGILAGSYNASQGLNAGISQGNANNSANLIGGLISGAGTLGGSAMAAGASAAPAAAVAGAAGGGVVPGYAQGGMIPEPLSPIAPGLVAAMRAHGGMVPGGQDTGADTVTDGRIGLRPGEVVVNPENPEYPRARAAVEHAGAMDQAAMDRSIPAHLHALAQAIVRAFTPTPQMRSAGTGG